jgi:hypothetical protein
VAGCLDSPQYTDSNPASVLSKSKSASAGPVKASRLSSAVAPSPSTAALNHSSLPTPSTSVSAEHSPPSVPSSEHQQQNHHRTTLSRPVSVSVVPPTGTHFPPQRTLDEQGSVSPVSRPLPSPPSHQHRRPSPKVQEEAEFSSPVNSGYNTGEPGELGEGEEDSRNIRASGSDIRAEEEDRAMSEFLVFIFWLCFF